MLRSWLITGGSGFLGRGLANRLLADGAERVCILSRSEWRQYQMRQELNDDPRLRFFIGDVRDRDRVRRSMVGIDCVIHTAALKRVEVGEYNADEMARTNILGTVNCLEAAEQCGVERFVLVSSDKAHRPVNAYGASKLLAERIVLGGHDLRGARKPLVAVCRYGNVAGSTGSVIPIWMRLLEQAEKAKVTDPDATRFWMSRPEAVEFVLSTARRMIGGELRIPDLPAFSVGDLALALGLDYEVVGMRPSEKKHESMSDDKCSANARRMSIPEIQERLREIWA